MNLLSVGAAYGTLDARVPEGGGKELFLDRSTQIRGHRAVAALMLFSVLFGLSMDYQVFLLTRIHEALRAGPTTTTQAVSHGLRTTGAIITGAALIMVAVFFGFALGDLAMLQQMGVGLAVAVLLDAFVVRTVLVPSTMRILGRWNWYFPKFLEFLPHVTFEAGDERDGIPVNEVSRVADPVKPEGAPVARLQAQSRGACGSSEAVAGRFALLLWVGPTSSSAPTTMK